MSKVMVDVDPQPSENQNKDQKKLSLVKPNLFLGRSEPEDSTAHFPDWDIVPPHQFINPRVNKQ